MHMRKINNNERLIHLYNLWLEKLIPWAAKNRTKIYNSECLLHTLVGFFLVFLSYQIGHKHINLLQNGVKAWGIVVDYKQEAFVTNSGFSNTVKDGGFNVQVQQG